MIYFYLFLSWFVGNSCWVFNSMKLVRWVCVLDLWPVYGENADELVSSVRVALVQECGANVSGSVYHLWEKKKKKEI